MSCNIFLSLKHFSGQYLLPFLVVTCFGFLSESAHDFHVSRCEVHYRVDKRALEVSQQIFIDDLEVALATLHEGESLFMATEKEHKDTDAIIALYLEKTCTLTVGGHGIPLNFLGKQYTEDLSAVWVFLEANDIDRMDAITIRNAVLLELFDDQKNIISFKVDRMKDQMFLLDNGKPEIAVEVR